MTTLPSKTQRPKVELYVCGTYIVFLLEALVGTDDLHFDCSSIRAMDVNFQERQLVKLVNREISLQIFSLSDVCFLNLCSCDVRKASRVCYQMCTLQAFIFVPPKSAVASKLGLYSALTHQISWTSEHSSLAVSSFRVLAVTHIQIIIKDIHSCNAEEKCALQRFLHQK